MKLLASTALLALALLAPAAHASQLWQVHIEYVDRTGWYAPHEAEIDHLLYFTELPTLTTWKALGYIVDFGESACVACFVGTRYRVQPNTDPFPESPTSEPSTFALLGAAIMAGCACLWRMRGSQMEVAR